MRVDSAVDATPEYLDENGNADPDLAVRWLLARMQEIGRWSTDKEFAVALETDGAQLSRAKGGVAPVQAVWFFRLAFKKAAIADLLLVVLCDLLDYERPVKRAPMPEQDALRAFIEAMKRREGMIDFLLPLASKLSRRRGEDLLAALGLESSDAR